MTEQEPKSECCGADVEMDEDTVPDSGFRLTQETYYYCSKCHKPCKVKEEQCDVTK